MFTKVSAVVLKLSLFACCSLYAEDAWATEKLPKEVETAPLSYRKALEAYPKVIEGRTLSGEVIKYHRCVIYPPKTKDGADYRVLLTPGFEMVTDGLNRYHAFMRIYRMPLKDNKEGFYYYHVDGTTTFSSTLIGGATNPKKRFVSGFEKAVPYSNDKPLVVYKEGSIKLKYSIIQTSTLNKLERAAEGGDAEAQFSLAKIYHLGEHQYRDIDDAFDWYEKAGKQGLVKAQYALGLLYSNCRFNKVKEDRTKAIYWLTKASKAGDAKAKAKLAEIQAKGAK